MRVQWTSSPLSAAQHPLLGEQLQVAEGDRAGLLLGRAGAAQQGADPRRQLLGHERLGDVVVRPGLEPGHHVVGVRARRHDDDGDRAASGGGHGSTRSRPCPAA